MKNEDMEKISNQIKEKLGVENSALISEELVTIITDNTNRNKDMEAKETQITQLKNEKNDLITTNGKLFQQVTMSEEPPKYNEKMEEPKKFSFKTVFDDKGNFID